MEARREQASKNNRLPHPHSARQMQDKQASLEAALRTARAEVASLEAACADALHEKADVEKAATIAIGAAMQAAAEAEVEAEVQLGALLQATAAEKEDARKRASAQEEATFRRATGQAVNCPCGGPCDLMSSEVSNFVFGTTTLPWSWSFSHIGVWAF